MSARSTEADRCTRACKAIVDERHQRSDFPAIMQTIEITLSTLLMVLGDDDHERAAELNALLGMKIDERIAFDAAKERKATP